MLVGLAKTSFFQLESKKVKALLIDKEIGKCSDKYHFIF